MPESGRGADAVIEAAGVAGYLGVGHGDGAAAAGR